MSTTQHAAGATPDELFQKALFGPVVLPWKTVFLEPTPLSAYAQRPATSAVSAGELYHANSKLFPQHRAVATPACASARAARAEYARKRAASAAGDPLPPDDFPGRVRAVLERAAAAAPPELFYALEIRVAAAGSVFIAEPLAGRVQPVRSLRPGEMEALDRAVDAGEPSLRPSAADGVVAVVGAFARSEVLLGSRGYRRTVLDAGRMAGELLAAARAAGGPAEALYEFYDRDVDRLLEVDGVEQGTLVLLTIGGGDAHRQG